MDTADHSPHPRPRMWPKPRIQHGRAQLRERRCGARLIARICVALAVAVIITCGRWLTSAAGDTIARESVMLIAVGAESIAEVGDHRERDRPFCFGAYRATIDQLDEPRDVAIDTYGRLLIADAYNDRIVVIDRNGAFDATIGASGSERGELKRPGGIAVTPHLPGHVFVCDTGNNRVQQFDGRGRFVRRWGQRGWGAGEFLFPGGIAVGEDRVYVADSGNNRVQVFDVVGDHLFTIGEAGSGDGELLNPMGVAFDNDGAIYVADTGNNRVQQFDHSGRFVRAWGQWGPFPGMFDQPSHVVVRDERIFVTDTRNHRVQVFTTNGDFLYQWGAHAQLPREGQGKLHYPLALAIDPTGERAAICEAFENRVQMFDVALPDVDELDSATPMQPRVQQTHFGSHMDIAGDLLAIAEPELYRVHLFRIDRPTPVLITTFGMRGTLAGQFVDIADIAFAADARELYICDPGAGRVQRFALSVRADGPPQFDPFAAKLLQSFDIAAMLRHDGYRPRRAVRPAGVELSPDGQRVFLLDAGNNSVYVFDAKMHLLHTIDSGDMFERLTDIRYDAASDALQIMDAGQGRIESFGASGVLVDSIVIDDRDAESPIEAVAMTGASSASLWLTDRRGGQIVRQVSNPGNAESADVVTSIGVHGSQRSELWKPGAARVHSSGRIFIADEGNHRVQVYEADGRWLMHFGIGRAVTANDRQVED